MPKISVIVPVYNVEKYLSFCLDSIKAQTFINWECILVDDGSSDSSGKICDEYVNLDNRFVVVHQKNSGASIARNAGLNYATGDWITFVDSDDWIDKDTFEKVLHIVNFYDIDMVQWGIILELSDKKIVKSYKDGIVSNEDIVSVFEPSSCHKLFSRRMLNEYNIRFPEGYTLSEDSFFSFSCYLNSKKIYNISESFYHYRIHPNSSTHNMSVKNIMDEVEVIRMMEQLLISKENNITFSKILIKQKIEAKNHTLFLLKEPNCELWRELFPEVLSSLLRTRDKKIIIYLLLSLHMDFIVKLIINLYKKK